MQCNTPVLIVGAGPVGLALAAELGWRGIDCMLVEKSDGGIGQPRMDMVGVRTMEFARRWGIVEWVEQAPYPRDYPQDNVYLESLTGLEFGREVMPCKNEEKVPPQSPQKRERCPQDMFDPVLQRLVRQFPGITTHYDTEFMGFVDCGTHVEATLREVAGGQQRTVTAAYVVGTDGGSSAIRSALGIKMLGKPVLTYTTNVIFKCADFTAQHDKGKAYRFIFIGPEGTWLTIVAINGKDRWRMSLVGSDEKRTVSEDEIRGLVLRAMGKSFQFEIESVMPWVRRELVAEHYGKGRVFIAGDAAHLMSPTGGFGMNTGIGDAVDLGWKLAAVVQGWGDQALLDSYEDERRPVAVRNVNEASINLELMLKPRTTRPPAEIFMSGQEHDRARHDFGTWYGDMMKREWYTIGIHLGYRYDDSPIIVPDGTPAPPMEGARYDQTSRPGARAPHVWLADGRSTLDLFGRAFVLLRLGTQPPDCKALEQAAAENGVPLDVVIIGEPAVFEAYEHFPLVLVRPDGHVAWRSAKPLVDAAAIISTVRGAAKLSPSIGANGLAA